MIFLLTTIIISLLLAAFFCFLLSKSRNKQLLENKFLMDAIPDPILICNKSGDIIEANDECMKLFGYTKLELQSRKIEDLMPHRFRHHHPEKRESFFDVGQMREMAAGKDLWILTKDQVEVPVEISLGRFDFDGTTAVVATINDITKRKQHEQLINQLAYFDSLTGIPNRLNFNNHVKDLVISADSASDKFAVFLIDLDDFKKVNDTLGHHAGDEVLKEFVKRINVIMKQRCDDKHACGCFAARLGGDEFVMVTNVIHDEHHVHELAQQIFNEFKKPFEYDEQDIDINLSVGIGIYPEDGDTMSVLLKSADLALYAAKDKGKNTYMLHDDSMNTRIEKRLQYEKAIDYFIETKDFYVHYQPIVDSSTQKILGCEALFRCNKKKFPHIFLGELIEVAEENLSIDPLGMLIFNRALQQMKPIIDVNPEFVLSINVSVIQLEKDDFVGDILYMVESIGVNPKNIAIEVTESLFMNNSVENIHKLKILKSVGFHLSIDDFGKGYSSMSYLRRLPIDKIKIDKEFIDFIAEDQKALEIVKGIVSMSDTLKITTLAEGVETEAQLKLLTSIGTTQIQGYYTGKPMEISSFNELMK